MQKNAKLIIRKFLTQFQPIIAFHKESFEQSFDIHPKTNDWFLYEMKHWAELSYEKINKRMGSNAEGNFFHFFFIFFKKMLMVS